MTRKTMAARITRQRIARPGSLWHPSLLCRSSSLFKKSAILFMLQRSPGLGSPPAQVSRLQEDSMTGPLVGDRNTKVG